MKLKELLRTVGEPQELEIWVFQERGNDKKVYVGQLAKLPVLKKFKGECIINFKVKKTIITKDDKLGIMLEQ